MYNDLSWGKTDTNIQKHTHIQTIYTIILSRFEINWRDKILRRILVHWLVPPKDYLYEIYDSISRVIPYWIQWKLSLSHVRIIKHTKLTGIKIWSQPYHWACRRVLILCLSLESALSLGHDLLSHTLCINFTHNLYYRFPMFIGQQKYRKLYHLL